MIRIIEGRSTGKTSRLMLIAKEQGALFVCSNPEAMRHKAHAYGITGIDFVSYYDFLQDNVRGKKYVIDEMEDLVSYIGGPYLIGYSLTNEN